MRFSAVKRAIVTYKLHTLQARLLISGLPKLTFDCAKSLGMRLSCSFNFHKEADFQFANANRTNGSLQKHFALEVES